MLFNSFEFLAFLCIVLPVYFFLKHLRRQNYWLLAASYFFYGCWDWRFLSLIVISTLNDYFCAKGIDRAQTPARRRIFLWLSIGVNLGILGFFKYYGFFVGSLTDLLGVFHITFHPKLLDVILPMGISFYTFQTMSYTIDVYQRKYPASHRFLDFALYVAFFPQLVAGPIERAHRLLHQIETPRCFSSTQFKEGCYLIYLGLFQKVFVADNLARIVNPVFAVNGDQNGALVLIAVYAFAFQIFCDFAGYTNIARGVAKLFGFELMLNFNLPYLAKNPQDFWRRWHISLSTWLRDYLYIPLGGSRLGPWRNLRNLVLVMALGGLWHGAAWTFVIWGLYHGLLLAGHRVIIAIKKPAAHDGMPVRWLKTLAFFHAVCFGWLIFRAQSMGQVAAMTGSLFAHFYPDHTVFTPALQLCLIVGPLLVLQFFQARTNDLLILYRQHWLVQTIVYAFMGYLILGWGILKAEEFIYFQF